MKPDRLVTLVGRDKIPEHDHMNAHRCVGGTLSYYHPCDACGAGMKTFRRSDVLTLLRREQRAQRARVTRITKTLCIPGGNLIHRDQLLAKLHGRTP